MMSQLSPLLDMYPDYIGEQADANAVYYKRNYTGGHDPGASVRSTTPWPASTPSAAAQSAPPAPPAPSPGHRSTATHPLHDTQEYVHPSVRTRILLGGHDMENRGRYDPPAMDDWRRWWSSRPRARARRPPGRLLEVALRRQPHEHARPAPRVRCGSLSGALLGLDPDTEAFVLRPKPTQPPRRSRSPSVDERRRRRRQIEEEGGGERQHRRRRSHGSV